MWVRKNSLGKSEWIPYLDVDKVWCECGVWICIMLLVMIIMNALIVILICFTYHAWIWRDCAIDLGNILMSWICQRFQFSRGVSWLSVINRIFWARTRSSPWWKYPRNCILHRCPWFTRSDLKPRTYEIFGLGRLFPIILCTVSVFRINMVFSKIRHLQDLWTS